MKALSVKEPWASKIASGVKSIETRTWSTRFRGQFLICASASPKEGQAGHAVALARIFTCRRMFPFDVEAAGGAPYHSDLWAWVLRDVQAIEPVPVKGSLGFFEVDFGPGDFRYLDRVQRDQVYRGCATQVSLFGGPDL
jgi:hypothetical protein